MRILFFIEPLVMHNRPFHYWAWLHYSASVFRALSAVDKGYEFRFILNEALLSRAVAPYEPRPKHPPRRGQGLPAEIVIPLPQEKIRRIFNSANLSILVGLHKRTWSPEQLTQYGDLVRENLAGFVPDIVITRTPVPFLAVAFPEAVILGTELGPFSRGPYPITTFHDPRGLWADSIPGAFADDLKKRTPTPEEGQFLNGIRGHYQSYFQRTTPFGDLEQTLRRHHRRLALLPLQFGGESGFDLNAPFRNQGEYLFHVLERLPADIGLIVVEHPTAIWVGDLIDQETREYVKSAYPHTIFVDFRMAESAGQYLLHHVDYVICISSSLALQAILWSKPLVSVGWSHYRQYATFDGVESIDIDRGPDSVLDLDGALAWLLRHYYPQDVFAFHDGDWLDRFLRQCRGRVAQGQLGLDFYDPIAPTEVLGDHLCIALPGAPNHAPLQLKRLMRNGQFVHWSRGDGPFSGSGQTSDRWELVADPRSVTRVQRRSFTGAEGEPQGAAGSCVRIERKEAGGGPSFFLQRIPDLSRCAGALMTLEFWAKSRAPATITTYFYQQVDNTQAACLGTPAESFALTEEWQQYTYKAILPVLGKAALGPRNHTEIVFCIPPEAGPVVLDLAMVKFGPGKPSGSS